MSKHILFLDDDESRHLAFIRMTEGLDCTRVHVWNVKDCIEMLNTTKFDLVSLDHDLELIHYSLDGQNNPVQQENTGLDVAKYIANHMDKSLWPKNIIIHSWNPVGSANMQDELADTTDKTFNIYSATFSASGFSPFGQLVIKLIGE